jgi:predicted ATPase
LIELVKLLSQTSRAGHAQFIIATHSPILLACPEARIYRFNASSLEQVDYEETEHFQVYRSFMLNPSKYLQDN